MLGDARCHNTRPSDMATHAATTAAALHAIEPSTLLEAIRAGAKPKVEDRLSAEQEHQREDLAQSFKLKHKAEAQQVKASGRVIASIHDHAHCKVEDRLSAEQERQREDLAQSFKLKHKAEAQQVKAARRRLDAIRNGAHCKVEDQFGEDAEEAYDVHRRTKLAQMRRAKRELKTHSRELKRMKANASPRVDARRCDEAELGRSQDTPSLAKPLDAVPEELRLVSAALLHAARRGSLARTLATPPDEQLWADAGVQQPPSAMRLRKAFEQAKSNRLSQRRKAVTGQDEEHQGALVCCSTA